MKKDNDSENHTKCLSLSIENDNTTFEKPDKTIHQLIEFQANHHPQKIAAIFEGQTLTYKQLNAKANQLANQLLTEYQKIHHSEPQRGTIIAICLEKNLDTLVAILAVLKTGSAYLPLDPNAPIDRNRYIIDHSAAALIITNVQHIQTYSLQKKCPLILLDLEATQAEINCHPSHDLCITVSPSSLAYVIYTSGTTGHPKGVLIPHSNVIHLFTSIQQKGYLFSSQSKWSFYHSYAFDFSIWEIFGALFYGAQLVIMPTQIVQDIEAFFDILLQKKVTDLSITPSAFQQLIDVNKERLHLLKHLKYVVFGGEKLSTDLLKECFTVLKNTSFINMYGITEITVHATYKEIDPTDVHHNISNIGQPLQHLDFHVLDDKLSVVPGGTWGELYISGMSLAAGYLKNEELTHKKFISHAFTTDTLPTLLYRTGDIVRQHPNGDYEFYGRMDSQVKINGYRIELGEIEAVLNRHPDIQQSVVLTYNNNTHQSLVAFIVTTHINLQQSIKQWASAYLPSYMVPQSFFAVKTLPLTINNKVDTQALYVMITEHQHKRRHSRLDQQNKFGPLEHHIISILETLFPHLEFDLSTHFQSIGLNSLQIAHLSVTLKKELQTHISPATIFQHATVSDLAAFLKKQQEKHNSLEVMPIKKHGEKPFYPLSFEQRRLWFLNADNALASKAYTLTKIYKITGNCHLDRLEQAFNLFLKQQPCFRTVIKMVDFEPVQFFEPYSYYKVKNSPIFTEVSSQIESVVASQIQACALKENQPLFILETLSNKQESLYFIIFSAHHLITDGLSLDLLFNKIFEHYNNQDNPCSSNNHPLPLEMTYGDYVLSQQQSVTSDAFKSGLTFWKEQLLNADQTIHLPYDHPRAENQTYDGDSISINYDPKQLISCAKNIGCTVYAVLFSAYVLLLHKLSGQDDITVGTVCQTRNNVELDTVFGYFLNTIPIRSNINTNENLALFIKNFSKKIIDCLAFSDIPFGHIVSETQSLSNMKFYPIFQLLFTFLEHQKPLLMSDCTIESVSVTRHTSRYDMTLEIESTPEGMIFHIEYDKNLFQKATICGFITYFCNILEQIVASPEQLMSQTCLLDDISLQTVYHQINSNQYDLEHTNLWRRFEQAVINHPNDTAIVFETQSISFMALDDLSSRLACDLQNQSVKKGDVVAVYMSYTHDLPIVMLALLKLGVIYLPLEPDFPLNRLNFMLDDSKASLCIVDDITYNNSLKTPLFIYHHKKITSKTKSYAVNLNRCDPIYLIYTSGSTGAPKGVLGSYQATLNRFVWMWALLPFEKNEMSAVRTSVAFVDSIWEILGPLLAGSPICMLSTTQRKDLNELTEALETQRVTRLSTLPSLLKELVVYWHNNHFSGHYLKNIITSGEALPVSIAKEFLSYFPSINLINLYGSSEVAGDVSYHLVQKEDLFKRTIPIGVPIHNTQIYICDNTGRILAPGEVGELVVSGQGLNLGYLNNKTLTDERFCDKTIWADTKRIFYTKDSARLLFNGQLEYLGRLDSVEKIRGVRVNLGEIDEMLMSCEDIKSSFSMVIGNQNKRIKTFIVPYNKNLSLSLKDHLATMIRQKMRQELPVYLHSELIEFLDELPINNNGKIDKKTLQTYQNAHSMQLDTIELIPSTTAITLNRLVKEITQNDQINMVSSLISQGFHSLDIIVLINKIAHEFEEKISIKEFFSAPSITELSKIIEQKKNHITTNLSETMTAVDQSLSFQQQQICFIERSFDCHAAFQLSARFNMTDPLDVNLLTSCLDILYKRHPILGAKIIHTNEQSYIDCNHNSLSLHIIRINENTDIETFIQRYLNELIDMTHSLFKTTLIPITSNKQILLFQAHHIIFDAWSFNIFINELTNLYQKKDEAPDTRQRLTYAHYVAWQKNYTQHTAFKTDCEYWLQELAHPPQTTTWPEIYSRPNNYTFDGDFIKSSINKNLYIDIQKFSSGLDMTAFTYFLACYIVLLHHETKQKDLIIGVPISNRVDHSFNDTIGLFSNTLPMRILIEDRMTFLQVLAQIKQKMIELLNHQNMTLSQLLDITKPKRSANKHPFFQTIFSYNDQHNSDHQLTSNVLGSFETSSTNAVEYDLSFFCFCQNQSIDIVIKYNTNLYNKSFVLEIMNVFHTLSMQLIHQPNLPLNQLNALTKKHHFDTINYGKGIPVDFEKCTVIELITRATRQYRHKIALTYKNRTLTYGELLDLIHQLTFQLSQTCTPTDTTIIGVLLKDPIDRLIAMLTIFNFQAIYLPLDSDAPIERLKTIAEDSCPALLITSNSYLHKITSFSEAIFIEDLYLNPKASSWRVFSSYVPSKPVYMLYTSGSTGKPKGTIIAQNSLLNVLHYFCRKLKIDHHYEIISLSDYTFDISILEHLIPLMYAASVSFFDKNQKRALQTIADKINTVSKPLIQLTPSYLSLLSTVDIRPNNQMMVLIGGESLSPSLAQYLLTLTNNIWHVYGPTEACIWCTVHQPKSTDKEVYIGSPIDNVNAYVLDDDLQPLGIGKRGNLYISGECLAIAYHNNPQLTQDKFFTVNNEYLNERLYDTGDMAYWIEPGLLKYSGRKDRQVKLLGHRIELGEIETVLNSHPNIKSSAVKVEGQPPSSLSVFYMTVDNTELKQQDILDFLSRQLPESYIPYHYHQLSSLPLTKNGKIDYSQLSTSPTPIIKNDDIHSEDDNTTIKIIALWRKLLSHTDFDLNHNFFEIGGNSFLLMQMMFELQQLFPIKLSISDLFSKSTIKQLSHHIEQLLHPHPTKEVKKTAVSTQKDKIAVIGMAVNVPGAQNLDEFWDNLCHGKESLTRFSDKPDVLRNTKNGSFVPSCGLVDQIEYFDADFFDISHAHSTLMDPQQRLLLECAWTALENAAYVPEHTDKRIGVVASVGTANYFRHYVLAALNEHPDDAVVNEFTAYLMNDKDLAATRIAYHLNLTGPALTVGTACSSSLVAIIEACRLLNTNAADMMLAGGASLLLPNQKGYWYLPDHILSQDGHCRAFSQDATGTVPSSGVGVVVLKRLSDALNDNDHIITIIEGSAINNDGKEKLGFTTPSYLQQKQCIESAISDINFNGKTLAFIEAHGTGTKLGDAVEMKALAEAYQNIDHPCAVGSVKSNLGHTDTASGVVSFIKAGLSLYHKTIVPSLNFSTLNENIALEHSSLYINTQLKKLDAGDFLGAVNSLGLGGTNAHVILSNYEDHQPAVAKRSWHIIKISAPNEEIYDEMVTLLKQTLIQERSQDLHVFKNMCFTLLTGRRDFKYKKVLMCRNTNEALHGLQTKPVENHETFVKKNYIYVIPDFDEQHYDYGQSLYHQEPMFQETVDTLFSTVKLLLNYDLKSLISHQSTETICPTKNERLCYYLVIHFALTTYLIKLGIQPKLIVGLGFGQFIALLVSGEFDLDNLLSILFLQSVDKPQNMRHPQQFRIPIVSGFDKKDILLSEVLSTYHLGYLEADKQSAIDFNQTIDEHAIYVLLAPEKATICQSLSNTASTIFDILSNKNNASSFYKLIVDFLSRGFKLNYDTYFYKQHCKKTLLPTYPFQKKYYWIATDSPKAINNIYIKKPYFEPIPNHVNANHDLLIVCFGEDSANLAPLQLPNTLKYHIINYNAGQWDVTEICQYQSIVILYLVKNEHSKQIELDHWMDLLHFINRVARESFHPLNISVASSHLFAQSHTPNHWRSVLPAICLGLSQEYFLLSCKYIDITESIKNNHSITQMLKPIIAIHNNGHHHNVSLVHNSQCMYRYEQVRQQRSDSNIWVPNATYLIIGGLGKIGVTLMRHISAKCPVTFVVTTRNLHSKQTQSSILEDIKKNGSKVLVHEVDVTKSHAIKHFMTSLGQTVKKIEGIFYCAGLSGEQSLCAPTHITLPKINENFNAKAYGLDLFLSTLNNVEYDYAILMSSMSSELVGPNQILYSAANRYAESLVNFLPRWQVIQWDNWSWQTTDQPGGYISAPYAIDALEQIIALKISHALVSQDDIASRFNTWTKMSSHATSTDKKLIESTSFQDYFYNLLIEILGKENLDINKNFLELGGDSLLAIDIRTKVFMDYGYNVTLDEFINSSSMIELANKFIAPKSVTHHSSARLISMKKGNNQKVIVLIHPVTGSIYCYTKFVKHLDLSDSIVAIENYTFDSTALQTSVTQTAEHYINLLLSSTETKQYMLVGLSYGGTVALEMAKLLRFKGLKANLIMIDSWAHFNDETWDQKAIYHSILSRMNTFLDHKLVNSEHEKNGLIEVMYQRIKHLQEYKPSNINFPFILIKAKELLPEYQIIDNPSNHWHHVINKEYVTVILADGHHDSVLLEAKTAEYIDHFIQRSIF